MKELDILIEFLLNNKEDSRINISRSVSMGHLIYTIDFTADVGDKKKIAGVSWNQYFPKTLTIKIDNKNKCLMLEGSNDSICPIYLKSDELLKKWSDVIEKYLDSRFLKDMESIIEDAFSGCENKDIHREWKMKKLFE